MAVEVSSAPVRRSSGAETTRAARRSRRGGARAAGGVTRRYETLHAAVRHLLSRHVDVVYGDVDLATVDDVDEATAELNELGFFASGLVLHGADGHDHLRLQLLDSEEIELEQIVCDSPFAEALKRRVLEDMARVVG